MEVNFIWPKELLILAQRRKLAQGLRMILKWPKHTVAMSVTGHQRLSFEI
jgi:hypothetical protein